MFSTNIIMLCINSIVIEVSMGRLLLYCKTNIGMDNCDGLGDCSEAWRSRVFQDSIINRWGTISCNI